MIYSFIISSLFFSKEIFLTKHFIQIAAGHLGIVRSDAGPAQSESGSKDHLLRIQFARLLFISSHWLGGDQFSIDLSNAKTPFEW